MVFINPQPLAAGDPAEEPLGGHGALFDCQAQHYADYRPTYPPHVYDIIYRFADLPRREVAVDAGCGNGQVCVALSQAFGRVIGIDASPGQLQHAVQRPNVTYQCSPAEATGLPDSSVDLVTAATCLHWFDIPAFYRECRRILRPKGALAAWSYMPYAIHFPHSVEAGEAIMHVHRKVYKFFHPKIYHFLHNHYEGQEPKAEDFGVVQTQGASMEVELTVEQLVGWVRSWSCYGPYVEEHGEEGLEGMLRTLRQELLAALRVPDERTPVKSVWPLTMILAKRPVPLAAGG